MAEGASIRGTFLVPIALDTQQKNDFATTLVSPGAVVGATSLTVNNIGNIVVGDVLIVDTGISSEPNPIQVQAVVDNTITFTPPLTLSHTAGAIIAKSYVQQVVAVTDSPKATYTAVAVNFQAYSGDVFTLTGSNSATVKVRHISVSGANSTGNQIVDVILVKRLSADTGGSTIPVQSNQNDSQDIAATAYATAYTSPPSVGNEAGLIDASKIFTPAGSVAPNIYTRAWDGQMSKCPVLNNANENLCVFIDGNVASLTVSIEWTEET